jgi:hypothetical protein
MDVQSYILIGWLARILIRLFEKRRNIKLFVMIDIHTSVQTLCDDRYTHFSNKYEEVTMRVKATGKISIFTAIFQVHSIPNQKPGEVNERQNLLQ